MDKKDYKKRNDRKNDSDWGGGDYEERDERKNLIPKDYVVDYKDAKMLAKFVTEHGKLLPARMIGCSATVQHQINTAVKRARVLGFIGFTTRFDKYKPAFEPKSF